MSGGSAVGYRYAVPTGLGSGLSGAAGYRYVVPSGTGEGVGGGAGRPYGTEERLWGWCRWHACLALLSSVPLGTVCL